MSGGDFDYAFMKVHIFADALEKKLDPADPDFWEHGFKPEVVIELKRIVTEARQFAAVMRAAEWLWSGDDREETFLRKLMDIKQQKLVTGIHGCS